MDAFSFSSSSPISTARARRNVNAVLAASDEMTANSLWASVREIISTGVQTNQQSSRLDKKEVVLIM